MPLTLESLTGGEPREVEIGNLEKELSSLWRSVAKEAEGSEAVTRAAALTLLVYVESERAAEEVGNVIGALAGENPCRAVVLTAQPEAAPAGLRAWVSIHSHLTASGRRQVCCEKISISARGGAVRDLDNVVLPLTVSGLPVCLWWRSARFDPPDYARQILRISNRVLVDSARFADPDSDMRALARHARELSGHVPFLDLNWARITPWRELIAQFFDPPRARECLERIARVRIEYERESFRLAAQGAQALLVAGWLAGRLKWQPGKRRSEEKNGTHSFFLESPRGEVVIERTARHFAGAGKGVCFSITMETAGHPAATFSLRRGVDGRSVLTQAQMQGGQPISRAARLEVLDEAELMNEELQFSAHDRVYEESLQTVARMLES